MKHPVKSMVWLSFALLAGCTAMRVRTTAAADNLEHTAEVFASRAGYLPARVLVDQTREFRHVVNEAGDQDVVAAFQRLWRAYHAIRDVVYRSDNRQIRGEFAPVTRAFRDVQLDVRNAYSYADPGVHGSGGYKFDPYYN